MSCRPASSSRQNCLTCLVVMLALRVTWKSILELALDLEVSMSVFVL